MVMMFDGMGKQVWLQRTSSLSSGCLEAVLPQARALSVCVCVFGTIWGAIRDLFCMCVCVCVCFPWFLRGMFARGVDVFGVLVVGDAAKYSEHGKVFQL